MAQPFVWTGNTGQVGTPQQARDAREVAALLAQGRQKVAQNGWEGLAQLSNAWAERGWRDQAAQAEEAGIKSAAEALAGITPQSGFSDIAGALSNPWLSQPQSTIAAALLQQNLQSQDPAYQLDLDMKRAQLAQLQAPQSADPTSGMQNYNFLLSQGYDPQEAAGMSFGAGGTTVNNMGNIPAGYQIVQDPATGATRMEPIEGSPAWLDQQAALAREDAASGSQDTSTSIITSAAQKARDAYNSGAITTGVVGNTLALDPGSQAAEMRRQVETLKANASIENLNAMRQQSPTGGALGSVTEKENAMLANKLGALDPAAPNFPQQLDDYERTLLEIVHGPQDGREIYETTRPPPLAGETVVMDGVKWRFRGGDPGDERNWERAQ